MVDFALSASDLELVDGFKPVFEKALKKFPEGFETVNELGEDQIFVKVQEILSYLHRNGMDESKPVEIVFCNHRNLRGQVLNYYRFEGSERLDTAWIKSGVASMDAIIASSQDSSMRYALRSLKTD
jgi:ASC-1-like (ASCH) protein